jgi:hypothetical protein
VNPRSSLESVGNREICSLGRESGISGHPARNVVTDEWSWPLASFCWAVSFGMFTERTETRNSQAAGQVTSAVHNALNSVSQRAASVEIKRGIVCTGRRVLLWPVSL